MHTKFLGKENKRMAESLVDFLKKQATRSFRDILREVEGLTPEQAFHGRSKDWPSQQWGVGQDGSIAGIAYHVAAWKRMSLKILDPNVNVVQSSPSDLAAAPSPDDWEGIAGWLKSVGEEWNAAIQNLPPEEFDVRKTWEGESMLVSEYITHLYEHNLQHAAQIEYLKQSMLVSEL